MHKDELAQPKRPSILELLDLIFHPHLRTTITNYKV